MGSFLTGLGTVVDGVQETQVRMDRATASRFSVFWYFKRNENILSGIFADLLRGNGSHGQGTTFLQLFLEQLAPQDGALHRSGEKYLKKVAGGCVVETEHVIPGKRRIDILVRVGRRSQQWLAIENKPWAGEQKDQLAEYAEYVHEQDDRACVVYLSGDGTGSETIGDKKPYYLCMPYRDPGSGPSVEHWIRKCGERCEADRVRWFLMDMERYIRDVFRVEEADDG